MPARCFMFSICLAMTACGGQSADEAYQEYNERLIEGLNFEEEKSYYTERKQAEVDEQVPVYMERMGQERDEVIAMYLQFSQEQARCNAIELTGEQVDGDTAQLEYAQTDTCGDEPRASGTQKIRMINTDDGWKIDNVEVVL